MLKIQFANTNRFFVLVSIFIFLLSCNKRTPQTEIEEFVADSIKQLKMQDSIDLAKRDSAENFFPLIKYSKIKIESRAELNDILNRFKNQDKSFDNLKILRTLNRKETRYFRVGDSLLVPDAIIQDTRAYSVFPQYYFEARNIDKIVIVSNKMQSYACYEYGELVRFAAVNTGKEKTPTFPGKYSFVWKERLRRSSLDETWIMPFTINIHNEAGSAMHQFAMPGRPVSHSCIRQFYDDAEWIYNWGKMAKRDSAGFVPFSGTPVIVIDHFDFNRKTYGDWIDLASNKVILELPENPLEVEEALIPIIQIPKSSRGVLRNRERYLYAEDTLRARGIIRENVQLTPSINFNEIRKQKAKAKQKLEAEKLQNSEPDPTSN